MGNCLTKTKTKSNTTYNDICSYKCLNEEVNNVSVERCSILRDFPTIFRKNISLHPNIK
jgi:hypothetical protein